jgi:hypothetical protein
MSGIKDQENIEALRKRLYDRDFSATESTRHQLPKTEVDVSRGWATSAERIVPATPPVAVTPPPNRPPELDMKIEEVEQPPRKKSYRLIILLASVVCFIVVAIISSLYLFFGNNQISARNISINIEAPFSIAAGEQVPMQVSVSNQNSVPILSATLIINYPVGTKSNDAEARDLYEQRIPVDSIAAGEAINIPLNALLFGEENEDKEVRATVEYRVNGSNGTFFKEAEPVKIKINSSPLVVRVNAVERASSGQEIEVTLTVQSNTSVVQRNILITANYPNSFGFLRSEPAPSYGQNTWLISEIAAEGSQVIKLRGRISGVANEESELQFMAGTPRSDNQFVMSSTMTQAKTTYTIERPFIDVLVGVNGDNDGSAIVGAGKEANVVVRVTNTLDETIYDMRVEVSPKGNLIRDNLLSIQEGFYDSTNKTIRYEVAGRGDLAEVRPGESREFMFLVRPDINQQTAAFDVSTNVYARRVREAGAAEEIVGTAVAQAKYESQLALRAQAGRNDGTFADSGPIPPVANQETTYTLTFEVEAGANDLTAAVMTTSLPQHVTWLDKYGGEGTVEYNPVAKQIRWNIGAMTAKTSRQLQIQVSLLPSVTQVGTNPTLVGSQEIRATDRFTETTVRVNNTALTNVLSEEAGFPRDNGRVRAD